MPQLPDSGFDRAAPFYDRLAKLVFGEAQEQAQLALLPFVPANAKLLIIGGGSGWLLEHILKQCKVKYILYLDASPAMLQKAQKRYQNKSISSKTIVEFRLGTEAALQAQEHFNCIITPFLLDLFPSKRLSNLMQKLGQHLKTDGYWLFADFWPVKQPVPLWQQLLAKSMYMFFGIISGVQARELPNYGKHFQELQLQEVYSQAFYRGMIQSKVYHAA